MSGEGGGGIGSDAALGRAPPPPAPPADAPAALPLGLFCAGWPREGARWPLGYLSGRGLQQGVPLRKRRGIDCRRRESGGCLARGVGRGGGRCGGHIEGGGVGVVPLSRGAGMQNVPAAAGCVRYGTWRRPPRGGARKVEWISRVSRCGAAFPRTVNGNGFETDGLAASAGYRWVHLTVPTRHRPCALAAAGRHGCQSARWAAIEAFARLQAASHRAWRGRRHVARASLRS